VPRRSSSCVVCGRSKVPLVYSVQGRLWTWPWPSQPTRRREGYQAEHFARASIERRTTARCLLTADCLAVYEARRERQQVRGKLPADAVLRKALPGRRGWCRWCGEMIYQRDPKTGHVVQDRHGRMWHEGREVHPDAEPEPNCVREYSAQAFTFRDQVKQRDGEVCAACGRDCAAEREAWYATRPDPDYEHTSYEERWTRDEVWRALEPPGWDADHIVPLEDGGEHLLANAQTLCKPCHHVKTAEENSARAARRRGDAPVALGDDLSLR
jgi:hypothetical protein